MKQILILVAVLTACSPRTVSNSLTAFYVSQRTTRSVIECYYNRKGQIYTHMVQLTRVCPNSIRVGRGTE